MGEKSGELLLFDAVGRMVLQQAVAVGQQSVLLDLSSAGLPSGSIRSAYAPSAVRGDEGVGGEQAVTA